FLFFFSSRRRHTRCLSDWSSDVCSSDLPELSLARVGTSDVEFDRRVIGWMQRGEHASLTALTTKELHATGSHELLNWMVLLGAVTPARARVRFFGEMGRIDLAAFDWDVT